MSTCYNTLITVLTVNHDGPLHRQIREIADLLKQQPPPPNGGKFHVNFKDILKNVLPATPAAKQMANIALGQKQNSQQKLAGTQVQQSAVNVTIVKRSNIDLSQKGARPQGIAQTSQAKTSILKPPVKPTEVMVTRPPIPHSSSVLSKKSCTSLGLRASKKGASWRGDDNLQMLAALATPMDDDASTVTFSDDDNEEEGPNDFFPEDADETPDDANSAELVNRQVSLKHVQPCLNTEESPFEGIK